MDRMIWSLIICLLLATGVIAYGHRGELACESGNLKGIVCAKTALQEDFGSIKLEGTAR